MALPESVTAEAGAATVLRACEPEHRRMIEAIELWIATQPEARRAEMRRSVEAQYTGQEVTTARIRQHRAQVARMERERAVEAAAETGAVAAFGALRSCLVPHLNAMPLDIAPAAGTSRAMARCAAERQRVWSLVDTATVDLPHDRRMAFRERVQNGLARIEEWATDGLQGRRESRNR